MSRFHRWWPSNESSDANPFDIFDSNEADPFSGPRFGVHTADDVPWIPGDTASLQIETAESTPQKKTQRVRTPYGYGIDAGRTAKFRAYTASECPIYQYLQCYCGTVTMAALLKLAKAVVESVPVWCRPGLPTRSEKRSKTLLVMWMESNAFYVRNYLVLHPKP